MKRDMDILRQVVLAAEDGTLKTIAEESAAIRDHIKLALEAGLLGGPEVGAGHRPLGLLGLTPAGYNFAELARNTVIWGIVAARIEGSVGTTSFAVWLGLLEAEHKKRLKYAD